MRVRRFVGWYNLGIFVSSSRDCDLIYQAVQDVWCKYQSACRLGVPTSVIFLNVTDGEQAETGLERDLIQKVAELE